jgi:hypothetical protein
MSNMGYCRFQNTAGDLEDCLEALDDAGGIDDLSGEEKRAAIRLIRTCKRIAGDYGETVES